jgi:hypothetical protein
MIYASAGSYRATVWFDFVLPGPDERRGCAASIKLFSLYEPV